MTTTKETPMDKYEIREAAAEFVTLSRREQKSPLFSAAEKDRMEQLRKALIANNAF